MKKILMIGTGGTIASEMTEAGLAPGMEGADFLRYVPAVEKLCQVDPLQVCNIDSTDMTPDRWLDIARAVEAEGEQLQGCMHIFVDLLAATEVYICDFIGKEAKWTTVF